MRRAGVVTVINPNRGMVAIETSDDGFTIIELLTDFKIGIGDKMVWDNGYGLGSAVYENQTKGNRIEVYVQNHAVSASHLRNQLML